MAPLPIPPKIAGVESWHAFEAHNLIGAILLLSLFATVFGSMAIIVGRRKRRMLCSGAAHGGSSFDKENKSVGRGTMDASQGKEEQRIKRKEKHPALDSPIKSDLEERKEKHPVLKSPKKSDLEERKDQDAYASSRQQRPNDYLESLEKEMVQSSLVPIYPWITRPQSLPGPYDAPYYPLALPTIGVESSMQSPSIKAQVTSDAWPDQVETISYSRRTPISLLQRAVTVSSKGWRRARWTVTAG